jgi:hypothetical protein
MMPFGGEFWEKFKHAFKVPNRDEEKVISKGEEMILEKVASKIVDMKMTAPALIFLETFKPLSFIGNQVMIFLDPFVKALFNWKDYERLTKLMENRYNIERLCLKIEEIERKRKDEKKS